MAPEDHRGHAIEAKRGELPDRILLLADATEVASGAEAGVEVVLRDVEDVRIVEKLSGDTIALGGAETQAFLRLLRWAESNGRIERIET